MRLLLEITFLCDVYRNTFFPESFLQRPKGRDASCNLSSYIQLLVLFNLTQIIIKTIEHVIVLNTIPLV